MAYILCVDDDESISILIRQILRMAGHTVEIAVDGRQALECIAAREPDLLVLDWSMPYMDGISVCHAVKSNPFLSRLPVLMLTAQTTVEDKVRGFEAGADDYLVKPFEPMELTARAAALLRLVQRESERNPSSGLPGTRAIGNRLQQLVRDSAPFSVLYFDLDHFKPFADTFGFAAADEVITGVGALLGEVAATHSAFAGHIGGDDFLLISSNADAVPIATAAAARYRILVEAVVGPEMARRGHFTGLDRDGTPRDFKLAELTVVVVPVKPEEWISLNHLGEAAATWKKAARTSGGGNIVMAEL